MTTKEILPGDRFPSGSAFSILMVFGHLPFSQTPGIEDYNAVLGQSSFFLEALEEGSLLDNLAHYASLGVSVYSQLDCRTKRPVTGGELAADTAKMILAMQDSWSIHQADPSLVTVSGRNTGGGFPDIPSVPTGTIGLVAVAIIGIVVLVLWKDVREVI